jgi:deoxyribodipyrimidine photo-lyase
MRTSLFWYTKDFRVEHLPGLARACDECDRVVPVYIWDDEYLEDESANRLHFLAESLYDLNDSLLKYGSGLTVRQGESENELIKLAKQHKATLIFCTAVRDPKTLALRKRVKAALLTQRIELIECAADHLIEPEQVLTKQGAPFQVYTPFSKQVLRELHVGRPLKLKASVLAPLDATYKLPTLPTDGLSAVRQKGGSSAAESQWKSFKKRIASYHESRNALADEGGTSRLSAHLNFGTISVHRIVRDIEKLEDSDGKRSFLNELIWRDFNYYIAHHFPHVLHAPIRRGLEQIKWSNNVRHLEAWKEGRTGFPVVDAAMRQLRQTGWMHNRARMIVASFLVKDLHINWQEGEAYFMEWLTDGDQVQNNAGWQWSASTGVDAQPYFRIFNPASQGKRFDPDGEYVKRYVPELGSVPARLIHEPEKWQDDLFALVEYPEPIVDHAVQRDEALAMFKQALERSKQLR